MHRHRPKTSEDHGYAYALTRPDGSQNPAAHGGIHRVDRCTCGAERHTNLNGNHRESTGWIEADERAQ